jgi:phospholipase D1/2
LKYSQRRLQITALNIYDFYDILYAISKASGVSLYTNLQRHNSFAPVREKGYCKMYIDGEGYFSDVCDSLLGATSEVFIAGWWVSP